MERINEKFKQGFSFGEVMPIAQIREGYEEPKGVLKQKKFRECLEDMKTVLDRHKVTFFLSNGTFLGQHRENRFIPHDKDIDIGMLKCDYPKDLPEYVVGSGKFEKLGTHGNGSDGLEHAFRHRNGVKIDIFVFFPTGKRDEYYISTFNGECDKTREGYCKWKRTIRGLVPIRFFGRGYLVPANKDEHLTDLYGKDWKTPKHFTYTEGVEKGLYKSRMI